VEWDSAWGGGCGKVGKAMTDRLAYPVSTLQLHKTVDCIRQLAAKLMTGKWQVNIPGYALSHSKQTALYSWSFSQIQHIQCCEHGSGLYIDFAIHL